MARPISRNMQDYAGGIILGSLAPAVITNGTTTTVVGDAVEPHMVMKHAAAPVIATGSPNVFAGNHETYSSVARLGDLASCGHSILKCSKNVFVN